jgi:PAS domain S-box-containing protein
MKDQSKTKQVLIRELVSLRQRVAELEQSESERKRVDDALRLDREILANMREGVQLTRMDDGVIVYTNRSFEVLFGYDPGELVGNHVSILNAPGAKSPEDVANEIIKSLNQKGVWNGEIHNLRKDGTSFWCYANISEFKYQQYGRVWISVHQDITERKQSENELLESEERYRSFFQNSLDAVLLTAPDGSIIAANPAACRMFGKTEKEIYEGGREGVVDISDPCLEAALTERARTGLFKGEMTFLRSDGTRFPGELSSAIFKDRDGHERTSMIISDVTARKKAEEALSQSEENFRRSLDESPLGVRIVTMDGETLYANQALMDIYGYDSIEELRSTPVQKRYTPESYLEFQTRREQRRNGFEDPSEYAISIIRKDGSVCHLQVYRKEILWDKKRQYQVLYLDITHRELAEERLRESEDKYYSLFENMLEGFAYFQMIFADGQPQDLLYLDVNKAFTQLTGLGDVVGRKITEVIPGIKETNPELLEIYGRVALTGKPERFEDYLEPLKAWLFVSVYSPAKGYCVAVFDNITDRKLAEEELKKSEEKYRNIFETIAEGIYRTTPEGRFVIVNPAFAAICGYASPEEMMEKVTDIPNQLYANPEDRLRFQKRIAAEGKVQGFEVQFKHPQKGLVWVSIHSKAIRDEQGNIRYYDGTIEDITDRKRAEGALQDAFMKMKEQEFIIDQSPAVVWLWKAADGWPVEYVSDNVTMFGYTPDDFTSGRIAYASIMHPDDLSRVVTEVERHTNEGKTEFSQEYRILTKSGDTRWIDDRTSVRREPDGTVTHYQGVVVDITDRKRAEEELKQSYQQLRALAERLQQIREESRITIAREIHDELGGGLTGLKMDLSLMSQKIEGEKAVIDHDFLMKRIHSSNRLIDRLVQNVRLIGTKLRPSVLDDLGLIAALEWESEEFANRTGIPCEFVPAFEYVTLEETTATAVFRR